MAEGLQAGRLNVPVVADLAGFVRELRTKVEDAAAGLAVKVKIKVSAKDLRGKLETAVKEASKGVSAKIKVKVDGEDRFRTELDAMARRLASTDVRIPVRPDGDNARGGGLRSRLRGLIGGAQDEADRNPVSVPVQMRMPRRGRGMIRMLGIGSLVSVLQPAVGALVQYGAGLTALVSAAAPAVGVLGAIPGLIAATGTAAFGTILAFRGFTDAVKNSAKAEQQLAAGGKLTKSQQAQLKQSLDGLSPSARKVARDVVGLGDAWRGVRESVQERFLSKLVGEVKPAAKAVFPLLSSSLGDAAGQMGNLAKRGAEFVQTGPFRRDFQAVAGTSSKVLGSVTRSVGSLGRATLDFMVASGPFTERVGKGVERFARWTRASAAAGKETGSLARFLDHAGTKANQLARATRDLGKGLGGVGRAAQDSGNALLDGFEGTMTRFNRWANSKVGQNAMKQFFSDASGTFHELNALVGDFVRGLGRAAKDGGITDLIRQIRTQLMPALGSVFTAIGQSIGPAIVAVVSNLATAFAKLAGAGTGLGFLLTVFNGLLSGFNQLMTVVPGANTALSTLLGTMLALKVITSITGMLRTFGTSAVSSVAGARTSFSSLGSTMRGELGPGVMGPHITTWQRMGAAYRGAAADGGRLTGTLRGIGAANRVVSNAAGGMVAALGGPLGIAITGVTLALGFLATRQEAAARATQAHKERVNSLSQALSASGGVIDANVRAQAAQILQETELANGKGKLVDRMRAAGVTLGTLTNAYLGQGVTLKDLEKQLQATADAHQKGIITAAGAGKGWDDEGLAAIRAKDALSTVRGELEKGQAKQKELADAVNKSGSTGTGAYDRLQAAVQGFSDKTKSADERVESLRRAMDALTGNTESFHDATARLNQQMLTIDDTLAGSIDKAQGWGKALVDNDGFVNTATRNGQTLNSQLTDLRNSMLGVATRAQEAAEQGLMPMSEAMQKSQGAMENARAKAIALAQGMGLNATEAKALADQMGFIPATITTLMTTQGIPEATAGFLSLRGQLEGLGKGQSITVTAPTADARAQIEALGFTVTALPDGKNVSITAPTGGARADIGALAADIANAPNKKDVTVTAIINQAVGDLSSIQNQVATMKGKEIEVTAPTATAQDALKDLGYKIQNVDSGGKTVRITAPTGTPLQQVQDIQSKINSLTGKTVEVVIRYSTLGTPYVSEHADGGIVKFADGGIRRMTGRVRAFANGAEQHIAQVAKAGEMRLWAEPETDGEAYIPLASAKRKRSEEILSWVARYFGGTVVYPDRALRQYANGGVSLGQSSVRSSVSRPLASQGGSALVGGDLNLTMTSAPISPGEALNDALFELRRIRRGGAHAV
ncbi:hypothetical protein ACFV98_02880 [Streptomyces violascens]|uniref:hypothetical protein n=1 Tax=Streptomyces violascens TaxID=67381 RepID=UPI0036573B7D